MQEMKEQLKKKREDLPHFELRSCCSRFKSIFLMWQAPWHAFGLTCSTRRPPRHPLASATLVGECVPACHTISQERRKIAWIRINPQLKSLATEEYSKDSLFGPGFLKKASKRLDKKELTTTTEETKDKSDLRSSLSRGLTARYGGRGARYWQLYNSYTKFQNLRYNVTAKKTKPTPSKKEVGLGLPTFSHHTVWDEFHSKPGMVEGMALQVIFHCVW